MSVCRNCHWMEVTHDGGLCFRCWHWLEFGAIVIDPAEEGECHHAWHCERCGRDGPGMAKLRREWEKADVPSWHPLRSGPRPQVNVAPVDGNTPAVDRATTTPPKPVQDDDAPPDGLLNAGGGKSK